LCSDGLTGWRKTIEIGIATPTVDPVVGATLLIGTSGPADLFLCFFEGDSVADGEAEPLADALGEPGGVNEADDEGLESAEPVVESEDEQPAAETVTTATQRTSMRQRLKCSVMDAMDPYIFVVEPRWGSFKRVSTQSDARSWGQSQWVSATLLESARHVWRL
jgi:hypothetical protein